uniref:Uncharacterized protein n=1 Tax=Cacopsylla melanoneura TaxID=428564 RepID=A0A8D8R4J7_9HEMI
MSVFLVRSGVLIPVGLVSRVGLSRLLLRLGAGGGLSSSRTLFFCRPGVRHAFCGHSDGMGVRGLVRFGVLISVGLVSRVVLSRVLLRSGAGGGLSSSRPLRRLGVTHTRCEHSGIASVLSTKASEEL